VFNYKKEHTVICAIHNLSLLSYFQRVIILSEGKIIFDDKVAKTDPDKIAIYFEN